MKTAPAAELSPPVRGKTRNATATEPPAPRFETLWAALVYAVCTLSLAWPAFGGKFLVSGHSDQFIAGYAFRDFAAQSLRAGEGFPQWNPYLFGGMPYVAAMHGDIFYPTFLLRMLMPTDQAMTWGFAIHLFLAGIFTFRFARAWNLGFFASLVAGVAYMLSGQLAGLASPGHDGKLFVSALLPAVLLCLTRGIRDGRSWAWGATAFAVGMAVLSPHPQLLQYLLLIAGAYSLFLAFATHDGIGKLPKRTAMTRLGLALAAVIVGGLIGAIQFMPVREYVAWSPRSGGKDYAYATSYSFPLSELFNSYLPQFTGILDNYWGRNGIHFHSEYLGAVVLFLAVAAFGASTHRSFRRFWLGALIVSLLWALGGSTPFYRIVYAIVPGTKFFRAPSTIYFVYAFAVALFAGFGTSRLLAGNLSRRYLAIWGGAVVGIALLFSVGGASTITQSIAGGIGRALYPDNPAAAAQAWAERAQQNVGQVIAGGWRSAIFVLFVAALAWGIAEDRMPRKIAAWILVAVTAIDLWSIERMYWMFSPPAATLYASDAAIDSVKAAREPGRVIPFATQQFPGAPRDPALNGDMLMSHGVPSLLGYHGNELGRYQKLLDAGGGPMSPNIWRHENVRYLYTTMAIPDSLMPQVQQQLGLSSPMVHVLGPVTNSSGSSIHLYRLPGSQSAAWATGGVVKATDDQALATVLDSRFDPGTAMIVSDTSTASAIPVRQGTRPPVRVTQYKPGAIDLEIGEGAPGPTPVVVSENYFPGWSAAVNGTSLAVVRANYNLIGMVAPAGARKIELRFHDPAYGKGKVITLVGLAIALLSGLLGAFIQRGRVDRDLTPATA